VHIHFLCAVLSSDNKERVHTKPDDLVGLCLYRCYEHVTYYSVVGGDVVKTSMVVIHTSMLLLIFLYTAWKRKFTETRMVDVFCILLAIAVGVFWKLSDNDDVTNVLLQIIIVISTVPTIIGLQDGRGREKAISWFFAVSAYVFLSGSLIVDPETEGWVPYTYPFLRGLMCIGVIVSLKKRCRK